MRFDHVHFTPTTKADHQDCYWQLSERNYAWGCNDNEELTHTLHAEEAFTSHREREF